MSLSSHNLPNNSNDLNSDSFLTPCESAMVKSDSQIMMPALRPQSGQITAFAHTSFDSRTDSRFAPVHPRTCFEVVEVQAVESDNWSIQSHQ